MATPLLSVQIDPPDFLDAITEARREAAEQIRELLDGTNMTHDNMDQVLDDFAITVKALSFEMANIQEV